LLARGQQQDSLALLENLLYHVDALAQMAQGEPGLSQTDLVADMQMLAPVVDPQHRQALLQTINALYEGERLVGVLVQRQGTEWTIDGTQVVLTPDTLVQGVPRAGDVVEVVGRPMDDGRWQAQWIRVAARAEGQAPLEISIVGEVQRQGQTWRIDRHAFVLADPALAEALTPGALVEVHLRWDPQAEVWKAVKVEPKTSYRGQVREIYGYLEALEPHRVRVNGIWWTLAPEAWKKRKRSVTNRASTRTRWSTKRSTKGSTRKGRRRRSGACRPRWGTPRPKESPRIPRRPVPLPRRLRATRGPKRKTTRNLRKRKSEGVACPSSTNEEWTMNVWRTFRALFLQQKTRMEGVVVPDNIRCVQCGICSYNCPIGIDVRRYAWWGKPIRDSHCVTCGECVARCPRGVLRFEVLEQTLSSE